MSTLLDGGKEIACEVAKSKRKKSELLLVADPLTSRLSYFYIIKYSLDRPTKTSHCEIMSATHKEEHISVRTTSHSWGVWTQSLPPESLTILHTVQ